MNGWAIEVWGGESWVKGCVCVCVCARTRLALLSENMQEVVLSQADFLWVKWKVQHVMMHAVHYVCSVVVFPWLHLSFQRVKPQHI